MRKGNENTESKKYGLIMKILFGRNSAVISTIKVDMMVWIDRIAISLLIPRTLVIQGSKRKAIKIPYNTSARLFPSSMVEINRDGLLANLEIIRPDVEPCFPCNSIWSLLDEIKAISIPEKRAENNKQTTIKLMRYRSI